MIATDSKLGSHIFGNIRCNLETMLSFHEYFKKIEEKIKKKVTVSNNRNV